MKKTTVNGHSEHNGHVSLARDEYDAYLAREESYQLLIVDNVRTKKSNALLAETLDAQAQRMSAVDLKTTHLERIVQLQRLFIDKLRDDKAVAALEDLSEFWRLWQVHTKKAIDAKKATRDQVNKYEPDLFRSWWNWVNDAGRKDRTLNEAGTRADPGSAKEMQEHIIMRLRQDNAALASRLNQLEAEMEAHKTDKTKTEPQEKP